jgi:catechol 2,3-dioxygenase-like lactoylglutathione lyase family enzyme
MSSTAVTSQTADGSRTARGVNMRLEVIVLPVTDVDRARDFYAGLGWRLDADISGEAGFRIVQLTPPRSQASIIFGEGITSARPGSIDRLLLVVDDLDAAREELLAHGAQVSEEFHGPGAGFHEAGSEARIAGRDPDGRSYTSFASFSDPDGNVWLLQEIRDRLPGREWEGEQSVGVSQLAELLHETAEHHDVFEKTHQQHDWWDWYAPYLDAREHGDGPEEAARTAGRYMADVKHVLPR